MNVVALLVTDLEMVVFSRRALRLLFEQLVFIIFFLLLLDESSRFFFTELVIELEPIDMSALFLTEEEVDFLNLLLSCEVDRCRMVFWVTLVVLRIIF